MRLGATSLTVYDGASIVAQHARSLHKYSEDLVLDHYLEVLSVGRLDRARRRPDIGGVQR